MPTLYATIYENAVEVAKGMPLQEFPVAIGATSTVSPVIVGSGRKIKTVRILVDSNCFVTTGESPVALNNGTGGRAMSADNPEYFDVESGHKLAVIERV